jgi:hypothetical protein
MVLSVPFEIFPLFFSNRLVWIACPDMFRLQGAAHSVLACRIILNIRSVAVQAQSGASVALHSDYQEMHFVEQPGEGDSDWDIVMVTRICDSLGTRSYYIPWYVMFDSHVGLDDTNVRFLESHSTIYHSPRAHSRAILACTRNLNLRKSLVHQRPAGHHAVNYIWLCNNRILLGLS